MLPFRPSCALLLFAFAAISEAFGQDAVTQLPDVTVTADRLPAAADDDPFSITRIDREALRRAPQLRLDDVLRNEAAGFSLLRSATASSS